MLQLLSLLCLLIPNQCSPTEGQGKGVWVTQSTEVSIERYGAEQKGADVESGGTWGANGE